MFEKIDLKAKISEMPNIENILHLQKEYKNFSSAFVRLDLSQSEVESNSVSLLLVQNFRIKQFNLFDRGGPNTSRIHSKHVCYQEDFSFR